MKLVFVSPTPASICQNFNTTHINPLKKVRASVKSLSKELEVNCMVMSSEQDPLNYDGLKLVN